MIGAACVAMIRPKAMTLTPPSQGVSHRLQCLWMGSVGDLSGAAPDAVVGTKLEHPGGSQLLPSRRSAGLGLVIGALRVVVALLVGDVLDVVVIGLSDRVDDEQGFTQALRSEEHTSELQSLMRISYAVFCLKKKQKSTLHVSY